MKKVLFVSGVLLSVYFIKSCTPSRTLIMEEPLPDKSLLVGAILVENTGLEEVNEAKKAGIVVIVVGKSIQDGKEVTQGYRVKTNQDGYYLIPNVPTGSYVIKGIELDLGYATHLLIGSYWDGDVQVYRPEQLMIDYTVQVWPAVLNGQIISLNIRYFRIDAALRIGYDSFKKIENASISLPQIQHTMTNPRDYFKIQYPLSAWFKDTK
jgi:hypothetical protein